MARVIKVKCISNDNGGLALTIGKVYPVEKVDKYGNIHVKNDHGVLKQFSNCRFEINNIFKALLK